MLTSFNSHNTTDTAKVPEAIINKKGFAVLELFTSEGCSSCPPADDLMAKIQKEYKDQPVYLLAFHVDYWNRLGWKDPFSDPDYSKRQKKYAAWLNPGTVYTPQIVMNGKTEFVGSDEGLLIEAITTGLKETHSYIIKIKSSIVNGQVLLDYQTNAPLKKSDLVITLVQKSAQTRVKAGENTGRNTKPCSDRKQLFSQTLLTKNGIVSLTLPKNYTSNEWEVIAFVQNNRSGEIIAATKSELVINAIN